MQDINKHIRLLIHRFRVQMMCMDISCILVRIGWVFFFLMACYHFAYSQIDSKNLFNESIDFVNCEFAKQSVKEFNNDVYQKYLLEFPNCGGINSSFAPKLYNFLTENGMGGTVKLASAINAFKKEFNNEFPAGDEIDEEDVYNVLEEKLFNIPKIQEFKNKHQRTYPTLQKNIINQLQMNLVPDLVIENGQDDAVLISNPTEDNQYVQPNGGETDYDYYETLEDNNPNNFSIRDYGGDGLISRGDILWLFSLLMFGLLAFYFIQSVMPRYTVSQDFQSVQIDDDATKKLLEKLNSRMKDLKKEHHSLHEEFNQLNFRYDNLDRTTDFQKNATELIEEKVVQQIEENAALPVEAEVIEEEVAPKLTTFFLQIPNPDGGFGLSGLATEFRRTETVYKFNIIDEDGTQAEFEIVNDIATMLRALDDPDTYLKPVCRSNAIIPISATKIITDEKGIAILRNDEWKVLRKALIHYM